MMCRAPISSLNCGNWDRETLQRRRIPLLLLSFVQIVFCGGAAFGFAPLRTMIEKRGVDTATALHIGTVAIQSACLAQFVTGITLDALGPRICSFASLLTTSVGMFLLSIAGTSVPLLYASVILIGGAGAGSQVSAIHLGALFPSSRGLVVSFHSGIFQISFMIFLVFEALESAGVPLSSSAFVVGSILAALSVVSLIVWPDSPFELETPPVVDDGQLSMPVCARPRFLLGKSELVSDCHTTLWSQMFNSSYIAICVCFPIMFFFMNSYTIVTKEQIMFAVGAESMSTYQSISVVVMSLGVLSNPLFGLISDRLGLVAVAFSMQLLWVLFAVLLLISPLHPSLLVMAVLFYTTARNFAFSLLFLIIAIDFGYKYFGTLGGIQFLVAFAVLFLHSSLFGAIGENSMVNWNMLQIVIMVGLLAYPIYLHQRRLALPKKKDTTPATVQLATPTYEGSKRPSIFLSVSLDSEPEVPAA